MLELLQVNVYYGASHVLRDIDLSVQSGEIVSILGRNGVGKTTLLKSILGLDVRTRGTITLDGEDITARPTYLRARAGIGYVPQGRELIPDFSIRDNILMGCYGRTDRRRLVPDLVRDLFPYLRDNLGRRAGLLSGGQQQQLAIAQGAGVRAPNSAAGRAHGRHPAQHRRADRGHDSAAQQRGRPDDRSCRAEREVRARVVPALLHYRERRDRGERRDRRVDRRNRPQAHDRLATNRTPPLRVCSLGPRLVP